ncbi:Ig-like domain repeat protein [uncultured Methanobrevibacter sp.]|uniref:Ig-like domain repeat protein n=1 Tax=uncultured Methanobrevibacter sp. TaxID=253161 RepID=UPI002618ACEA|nr:Ig-like domain repeat protein [uncultured Methanobrevibacter sp.]
MTPNAVNVKLDNWLFLNATANPNGISLLQTADITFSLYSYVPDSGVSEYNSSRMLPFELNLTSNGKIDKNTTPLDSAVKYTPKGSGKGSVTATFITAIESIEFEITKIDPELKASAGEITYGENATITLSYNSTATGNINITLNGKKHARSFESLALNTKVTLPADILPDEYDVTVTYSGDGNFLNATAKTTLTVNRLDSNIQVHAYDINVTEASGVMFKVALPENATGTLTLSNGDIINVTKEGVKENGKLIINIKNDEYAVGKYNWTFNYLGDDIYLNSTADATSNILIIKTEIIPANRTVELTYNDTSKVNFTAIPEGISPIAFKSSNSSIVSVDSQGNIVAAGAGSAKITIEFEGNATHAESNATVTVTVKKAESTLDITNVILDYGNTANITAKTEGADGITAKINSQTLNVNNYTIQIPILDAGNYTLTVTTIPDANHNPTTKTANITVNKIDSALTIDNVVIDYGKSANITSKTEGADGITAKINDENLTVNNYTIQIPLLDAGNYTLTVTTIPDANHNPTTKTANITVNKIDSTLTVNDTIVDYGNTATVNVTSEGADKITAQLNDKELTIEGNTIQIPILDAGNYTLTVTTIPDKNHNPTTQKANITVNKIDSTLTVNDTIVDYGNTATVNVTSEGADKITAQLNDKELTIEGNTIQIPILDAGNYTLTVTTIPDKNHNPTTQKANITVNKIDSTLTVNDTIVDYGNTATVNVTSEGADKITAQLNDKELSVKGNTIQIPIIDAGNYTLTVTTIPDKNHNPVTESAEVIVLKQNATQTVAMPENMTVGDNATVNVNLPEDAQGNVTLTINGEKITTIPVTEGSANLTIPSLAAGNHTVEIAYSGDGNYNPTTEIKEIEVLKDNATADIEIDDNTVTIDLPKDARGNITVKVDGEEISTVPVENGTANVELPEMKAGNHTVEITYSGDDKYNPSAKSVTISIAKKNTELTAEDINATYKVDKYLEITLKDANAVPLANATVTVTLDTTKNYTTDEEGKITIKVSNMTPKTYTAEIIFKGDSEHFGCNTTTKITVKKATPKITAKAKTFKTTVKTKKYTITLKDNTGKAIKNAKVTLKVKGKTYKATTNSKGKATFKITKLTKKGTYKATITYKGNKYYNKTTQKAKITIKSAWKTVSKGSKDKTTVKKIQRALKNNGYYLHYKGYYLMIDGIYHDCTQRSVKEFQKANHLKQTGKVDEKTAKKLKII